MSIISNLVKKELIDLDNKSEDIKEFFADASTKLEELGFVEETFFEAIYKREQKYPTGLELPNIVIAIPHTDVEHIKEPFIFVNKIVTKSLSFIQMGTDDVIVEPEYVIVLGIKEPTEQVGLLSTLIELFGDQNFINKFESATESEEIYELLSK